MTTLASFQHQMAHALIAPASEASPGIAALARQPGFAVYRNTVMKSCIDALQANYPAVTRLVGEDWLRSAAALYVRDRLPDDARMLLYGNEFAGFLENFAPAAELPYLAGVARLDRFWSEAHAAPDSAPLDPAALSGLAPHELAASVLHPHPSARWAWFADLPVYTIWKKNRDVDGDSMNIAWRAEGALLLRPYGMVTSIEIGAAGCAFMDRCHQGRPLAEAASAALEAQPDADLAHLLSSLLTAGAFCLVTRPLSP